MLGTWWLKKLRESTTEVKIIKEANTAETRVMTRLQ